MKVVGMVFDTILVYIAIMMLASLFVGVVASSSEPLTFRVLVAALALALAGVCAKLTWAWIRRTRTPTDGSPQQRTLSADTPGVTQRQVTLIRLYWLGACAVCTLGGYIVFFTDNDRPWSLIGPLSWTFIAVGCLLPRGHATSATPRR